MGNVCIICHTPVTTRRGSRCPECKKRSYADRWANLPPEKKAEWQARNRAYIQEKRKTKAYRVKEKVARLRHKTTHVYKARVLDFSRSKLLCNRVLEELDNLPPNTSAVAILWKLRETPEKWQPLRVILQPLPSTRPTPKGWGHLVYMSQKEGVWTVSRHELTRETDLRMALYMANRLRRHFAKVSPEGVGVRDELF